MTDLAAFPWMICPQCGAEADQIANQPYEEDWGQQAYGCARCQSCGYFDLWSGFHPNTTPESRTLAQQGFKNPMTEPKRLASLTGPDPFHCGTPLEELARRVAEKHLKSTAGGR